MVFEDDSLVQFSRQGSLRDVLYLCRERVDLEVRVTEGTQDVHDRFVESRHELRVRAK